MSLRKIFTAAVAAGALLLMQGCTNPSDYVVQNIDPAAQCTMVFNDTSEAADNAQQLAEMLSQTPYAQKLQSQLASGKMTSCIAAMNGQSYMYDAGKQLLVMDHNTNVSEVALNQIYQSAYTQAALSDHWSEKLNPGDFMIWANALDADFKTDFIAGIYDSYGQYSDMWSELKESGLGEYAKFYETQAGTSSDQARSNVFTSLLSEYMSSDQRVAEYADWYSSQLDPREEPTITMCLSFDGSLDPCLSSETVYPSADSGESYLNADHFLALTKGKDGHSYINQEEAETVLAEARMAESSADTTQQIVHNLEAKLKSCCDGSTDGSTFGLGTRGFGLAF